MEQLERRSTRILFLSMLMASMSMAGCFYFFGTDPFAKPNRYILPVTVGPLILLMAIRLMNSLFGSVHSLMERAGQVSTWFGVLVLGTMLLLDWQVGLGPNGSATFQFAYAMLAVGGMFLVLLGDMLRHYNSYRRGSRLL